MLGSQGRADESRVEGGTFLILLESILAFLNHAFHTVAVLAGWLLAEFKKYLLESLNLIFGLLQMG